MEIGTMVKTLTELNGEQNDGSRKDIPAGTRGIIDDSDGDEILVQIDGMFCWTTEANVEVLPPIALKVIDDAKQHFVAQFARPGRIEIVLVNGRVIAHIYEGADTDKEQEPLGMYDGTQVHNTDWTQ